MIRIMWGAPRQLQGKRFIFMSMILDIFYGIFPLSNRIITFPVMKGSIIIKILNRMIIIVIAIYCFPVLKPLSAPTGRRIA